MVVISLYFGRDRRGGAPVSEAEFDAFAAGVLGRAFPDGFTVFDASGQWREPQTGTMTREATKVVQVGAPAGVDMRERLEEVIDAYKRAYQQVAVGVVSSEACGAF